MYRNNLIIIALFLILSSFASAQTQTFVVVPNEYTNTEGPNPSGLVFDCNPFARPNGQRYQQVYLNSQIGDRTLEIIGINFRSEEEQDEVMPVVIPTVQIDMSITQTQPDNLVATFANNLGPIVTTVYSGPVTVDVPACGAGPCPFAVKIPLQTPFMYNPSEGNLIVDIRVPDCMRTFVDMDASQLNLSETSNVFTTSVEGVDDPDANEFLLNDGGFVTQFDIILPPPTITPIPTLSEWGLMAMAGILGIVGYLVIRRRKLMA